MTGIVLIIVAVTKTLEGAWIVLLLIPMIVALFKATHRHYEHVASELTLKGYEPQARVHNTVLVPIGGLQRAVVEALRYAETLSDDVRAIYVDVNPVTTEQLRKDWAAWGGRVNLVVLPSPFRSLMEPLLEYIEQAAAARTDDIRDGHPAGVRAGSLVAASVSQPDLAADQRRAAVPAEHRRHQRAIPSLEVRPITLRAALKRSARDVLV